MSDAQRTLSGYASAASQGEPQLSDWVSNGHDGQRAPNECQHCGRPVSKRFRRVYGDNDGLVWACIECTCKEKIKYFAAGHERGDSRGQRGRSGETA